MGINRSGYYKWLNRPKNHYELKRIEIIKQVEEVHGVFPSYGYHAIAAEIRENTGWVISDNLVHKCCKFAGVKSKMRHYKWKKTGDDHDVYKNEIWGNWKTTRPLEKVVSDMTVIIYQKRMYEWTFFVDVYNNSIITWSLSCKRGDPVPYYNCRDYYLKLLKKEDAKGPIYFHTDQGTIYSSSAYNQAIINSNIIRSMSRVGTPTDNPIIESLNGWIKAQIRCDYNINEWDSLEEFLEKYVYYFNHYRPSFKLHYKSPAQYTIEQGFYLSF